MNHFQRRSGDQQRQGFLRGLLWIGGFMTLVFGIELAVELYAQGFPALKEWLLKTEVSTVQMVTGVSAMARAYNNLLAMLLATIGLAIPLTANMHTPKLIDLFLEDRINRIALTLGAVGAAHALWVIYMTGPAFSPVWSYRIAAAGALLGWVVLIPYFFYVVRFLDPSTVIRRLHDDVRASIRNAADGSIEPGPAQDRIQDRLFQIGTIVIKALDRADRGVAHDGVWALREIMRTYGEHKPRMSEEWFRVGRGDFVGMSHHAIEMINEKRTWLEMHVLDQLVLCFRNSLVHAPDEVSTITNVNRRVAQDAARRGDQHVVSLGVRVFNTFLRDAINRRDNRAAYDIFYQYRQLAAELVGNPDMVQRIAGFFVTYADLAEQTDVPFVADLAGYDLEHVVEAAYRAGSPAAPALLDTLLSLPNARDDQPSQARVRAKLIAAGFFAERGLEADLAKVRDNLGDVPAEELETAATHLVGIDKQAYWEVTDRAINIEWTDEARRRSIRTLIDEWCRAS